MYKKSFLLLILLCAFNTQIFANEQQESIESGEIKSLRFSQSSDHSRLVFDINNSIDYKVFTLKEPHRLVIDIASMNKKPVLSNIDFKNSPITNIRTAIRNSTDLRVVLDLKSEVNLKHFILNSDNNQGNRLVVDLYNADKVANQLSREVQEVQEEPKLENPVEQKTEFKRSKNDQFTKRLTTNFGSYREKQNKINAFISYSLGAINNDQCKSSLTGEISAGVKINSQFSTQLSHVMADCYHTDHNQNSSDKRLTLNELTFRYSPLKSTTFFEYGLATYNSDDSTRSNTPVLGVGIPYIISNWHGAVKLKIYPEDETITYLSITFGFN